MTRADPRVADVPLAHPPRADRSSAFRVFSRQEWSALRGDLPPAISESDLAELRGRGEPISLQEVSEILLPLSRLLGLHFAAARNIDAAFLGRSAIPVPYIVAVAGSVGVGKSTFARLLQVALANEPLRPRVDLVT